MSGLFKIDNEVKVEKYSSYAGAPQYEITSTEKPLIASMFDKSKTVELLNGIRLAQEFGQITEEEADFLRLAAYRHTRFRYDQIAEYYAHATKEMQELMEDSALVIIDVEDAIAKGYAKLSKQLDEVVEKNKELRQ